MSADGYLGLRQWFADLDSLVPRVIKFGVTNISAVSEPRTTATAATNFPGFRDGAAFGAYQIDCRRCYCGCMWVLIEDVMKHYQTNIATVTE